MSTADRSTVLALPARVDAAAVASLYAAWAGRARALEAIDFGAVEAIDSTGVALVRCLVAARRAGGAAAPELRALPARYRQLCLAHRLDPDSH